MIFERFEDEGLSQFSYLLASPQTRHAVVVDPRRDVEPYLGRARERGLRIVAVTETHIHADYASGAAELAHRAGARLHLSAYDRGERYEVRTPHEPLREGDELDLGEVRLRVLHTPGHTPEHISFLVHEAGPGDRPTRFLTGDFLFIGSVGRPDLLGEDESRALAGALHDSLQRVLPGLPDSVVVHPGHGSGSMCGSGMGKAPERTLGEERRENPYLAEPDRARFIERLLGSAPPFPEYYRRMKEKNADGEAAGRSWPAPVALDPAAFARRAFDGHVVVDTRHQLAFGGGHIPGALGLGLDPDLSPWAGWVLPYDRPLLLVVEEERDVEEAVLRLARVGIDRVEGWLEGGMEAWLTRALDVEPLAQLTPRDLAARVESGGLTVLDVRTAAEWESGHIRDAIHLMGGYLADALRDPPEGLHDRGRPVAVICGTGYRSTVAASVLQAAGYDAVHNVPGGMTAWAAAGLPTAAD